MKNGSMGERTMKILPSIQLHILAFGQSSPDESPVQPILEEFEY
jgi:hypothetical protein